MNIFKQFRFFFIVSVKITKTQRYHDKIGKLALVIFLLINICRMLYAIDV